jgi:hypothetical protein
MASFEKLILSGSTNGRAIKVAATATPGTTIHTGSTNTAVIDEVWLYAQNTDTTARKLTIEWGGTSSPDDLIELTIPAESGLTLVAPGLLIKGAGTALVVRAFCASANVVTIHGYVNRIS